MVRRHFACDAHAALFRAANFIERCLRRKMRDVEMRAREFGELNIARHADGFRRGGHALEAESSGSDALAHHGASG